ncbi:hypothetical protein BH11PAT4_BH11PAT4_5480 [soil metagenome]
METIKISSTQERDPSTAEPISQEARVHFKNEPRLSEFEAQQSFNERRLKLIPQITNLIATTPLFSGMEVSAEFAHTGVSSLVCFLDTEAGRSVLKVPLSLVDGNGESRFLGEWEAAGVTVPHVMEEGQLGEHPYLIMDFVDAPPLQDLVNNDEAPRGVWEEMGRTLARMHTPTAEGFGKIIGGKPEYDNFEDWLFGPGIEKRVKTVRELGLLDDEHGRMDKVFGALLAHADRQDSSTLCHFDFTPNNILATEPITVFDPSPMLNHGIIDIGRSVLSCVFQGHDSEAQELIHGYFGNKEHDASTLQASIILNAYWKFPYQYKTGQTAKINRVRDYLQKTSHVL